MHQNDISKLSFELSDMIVFVIYCFSSYPRLYNVYEPAPNFMYNRIIIYNILSHYYEVCVFLVLAL